MRLVWREPPLPLAEPTLDNAIYVSVRLLQHDLAKHVRSKVLNLRETQSAQSLGEAPRRQAEWLSVPRLETAEPLLDLALSRRRQCQPYLEATPYGAVEQFWMITCRNRHDVARKRVDLEQQ